MKFDKHIIHLIIDENIETNEINFLNKANTMNKTMI